jgi:uncharacterized protein (UPF0332 family)
MVKEKFSSRTIINRAYYAMFYLLLALFIKNNIEVNTSKHTGIISIFDNAFIKTGIIDKKYSKILHSIFNERQIGDYKELMDISFEKAVEYVEKTREFIEEIKKIIK